MKKQKSKTNYLQRVLIRLCVYDTLTIAMVIGILFIIGGVLCLTKGIEPNLGQPAWGMGIFFFICAFAFLIYPLAPIWTIFIKKKNSNEWTTQ